MSPLQRAALTIKTLRARVDDLELRRSEPIAIVGMGCRFPGGVEDPQAYWRLLHEGVDAMIPVPADRWDGDAYYSSDPDATWKMNTREGGFLSKPIADFDCDFFGVSPREAAYLDPQQRLMLEVAWEALEDAGIAASSLVGSSTGVYVGILGSDYGRIPFSAIQASDLPYMGSGTELSFSAGRVSYVFGLQGPCMAITTACSSALVSTHLACQALRSGECDLALAAGVNLIIHPDNNIVLSRMRALAPDGRSKTFDSSANGYARGEGCGVVVLKRLSDALRDKDRVLAVVRGSAVNHDGPSGGLTVPNGPAQEKLLRRALIASRLAPADVNYVEAHGTGTPLGDPIELRALDAVLGEGRSPEDPLFVGSVKTNFGHLESAAGVASLIKVVLSMRNNEIPPHLHFNSPNKTVDWGQLNVAIPTRPIPWPAGPKRRVAGMSAFGLSGVNAHVLVEEAPPVVPRVPEESPRPLHVLTLSAKSPGALTALAQRFERALGAPELTSEPLGDICFTSNTGRTHFRHRLALLGDSHAQIQGLLGAFVNGDQTTGPVSGKSDGRPKVAFLFTGQGAQWLGMGEELFKTEPYFRKTLLECDEVLRPRLGQSLTSLLYPETRDRHAQERLDETWITQPALFAIEYSLARLWLKWGIVPDFVMGHSVGEYVAACVAEVFSLEDGLKLIVERARLMQSLPVGGAMASVSAELGSVEEYLSSHRDLAIAAINGPRNIVISGPERAVNACLGELGARGIRGKLLRVSHAFHSALMEPILGAFVKVVETVRFAKPAIPLISNLTGKEVDAELGKPHYWVDHLRRPVLFAKGMETLGRAGAKVFLEVGPRPTLVALGQSCLDDDRKRWFASLRPDKSDWCQMLESLASLYVEGQTVSWRDLDESVDRRKVTLPTYAFQRRAYWLELNGVGWDREGLRSDAEEPGEGEAHPLLGRLLVSPSETRQFESNLSLSKPGFLGDHKVYGQVILPGAAYVEMGAAVGAALFNTSPAEGAARVTVEGLTFFQTLLVPDEGARRVQVLYTPQEGRSGKFEIFSLDAEGGGGAEASWTLHAQGTVSAVPLSAPPAAVDLGRLREEIHDAVPVPDYYMKLLKAGLDYGPRFRIIHGLWRGDGTALAHIGLSSASAGEAARYAMHPAILDACFQMVGVVLADETDQAAYLPAGVGAFRVFEPDLREVWVRAQVRPTEDGQGRGYSCDFLVFSAEGRCVATIDGLQLKRVSQEALLDQRNKRLRNWLYDVEWTPAPLAAAAPLLEASTSGALPKASPHCLIFADRGGVGDRFAALLRERGWHVEIVHADGEKHDPESIRPDATAPSESTPRLPVGLTHLIDVSSLDRSDSTADVPGEALDHCVRVLRMVQSAVRANGGAPSLWLVTRGAQAVVEGDAVLGLAGSPLWGLGKAITREHPELRCRRVDLDPGSPANELAVLRDELAGGSDEDEVGLRRGQRYVSRLVRSRRVRLSGERPMSLRPDASYLVTGGLGGLGLKVAERLAESGARHLVLLGRREPSDVVQSQLDVLRARGTEVSVIRCDVAISVDLDRVIAGIAAQMPPLRGVVHAAGSLDDGILMQLTPARFVGAFAAKVFGAWNLHRAVHGLSLDFFTLFSSASSLIGAAGQGNYVAANAFMDALAHLRRAAGLPGLSINWGGWSEVGTASGEQIQRRMDQIGLGVIPPPDGLQIFERSLGLGGQLGVLPVDWATLGRQVAVPIYKDFVTNMGAAAVATDDLRQMLESLPIGERRAALAVYVSDSAKIVLGRPTSDLIDSGQGFFVLGMDSLMSVELRNRLQRGLGRSLPATVAFDNPTVDELVDYLVKEVLAIESVAESAAPELPEDDELNALLSNMDAMDDDDVQSLLRRGR